MIKCSDECGREIESIEAGVAAGWTWLEITNRLRCPQCHRETVAIMTYISTVSSDFMDLLPKESMGALKSMEGKKTIQPVVKPDVREDDTPAT